MTLKGTSVVNACGAIWIWGLVQNGSFHHDFWIWDRLSSASLLVGRNITGISIWRNIFKPCVKSLISYCKPGNFSVGVNFRFSDFCLLRENYPHVNIKCICLYEGNKSIFVKIIPTWNVLLTILEISPSENNHVFSIDIFTTEASSMGELLSGPPSLLRFVHKIGLDIQTGMDFLCILGVIVAFLSVVFPAARDIISFTFLWILYFSLYQVSHIS